MTTPSMRTERNAQAPLEIPIGSGIGPGSGRRFLSPRAMGQIRANILKQLASRMRQRAWLNPN